jgi:hypothetical protein
MGELLKDIFSDRLGSGKAPQDFPILNEREEKLFVSATTRASIRPLGGPALALFQRNYPVLKAFGTTKDTL